MEDTYKGQVDNPLSLNRYTYVKNNPLRYIDPSGHREADAWGNGGYNPSRADIVLSYADKAAAYADANRLDYDQAVEAIVPAEYKQEVHEVVYQAGATRAARTAGDMPNLGLGAAGAGAAAASLKNSAKPVSAKPNQVHHFATNKSNTYTPKFQSIVQKYNLGLDETWNKQLMPHQGRHPNAYHDYVLQQLQKFDSISQGDQKKFLRLFEGLKKEILDNPEMLTKKYWDNQ